MDFSDPAVQAALIGVGGVVLAALFGLAGVRIGGMISADASREAAQVAKATAEADRDDARRQRREDRTLALATRVLADADRHSREIMAQVTRRNEIALHGGDPDTIPDITSDTDAVYDACGGLYLSADIAVADAAWTLYLRTVRLGQFTYDAAQHRTGQRVVGLSEGEVDYYALTLKQLANAKQALLNASRAMLDLPPIQPTTPVFPDDEADHD